jgi:HD superfamily phosphodiesterase
MYSYSQPYVQSLLFDKKLIELGDWNSNDEEEIEKWNETTDYELQRSKAAQLITYLILRILGESCSSSGRIRVKRLGMSLANFEQILISSRGLEKKFYRDHLNHIIRVALLARAIGRKPPFNLPSKDLDKLVLACLFHDVGYPLSRITQTFRSTVGAIKNCYNIASGISKTSDIALNLNKDRLVATLLIEERIIEKQLKDLDHGLLSALEFISYLKEGCIEHYTDVIRAIAFHSPSFSSKIEEKLLTILILADELQDWGRPVNLTVIPKISNFRFDNNSLGGKYNTEGVSNYSILRQIYGKSLNLNRIRLPGNFRFELIFPVNNLERMDFRTFENNLQILYNECINLEENLFNPSFFGKLYENKSSFENIYYGFFIPKEIKIKVFNFLKDESVSAYSPYRSYNVFINTDLCELLFASNEIERIRSFSFRSATDRSIVLEANSDANIHKGQIKSIFDSKLHELALMLLAELRFYNICVQKIVKFPSECYPVEIGIESFPSDNDISKLSNKVKKLSNYESLGHLRLIRDCISNNGLFLFERA